MMVKHLKNKFLFLIILSFFCSCKLMLHPSMEFYSSTINGGVSLSLYTLDSTFLFQNMYSDEYGTYEKYNDTIIINPIVILHKGKSFIEYVDTISDSYLKWPKKKYYINDNNILREITEDVYKSSDSIIFLGIFKDDLKRVYNLRHWRNNSKIYEVPIMGVKPSKWRKEFHKRIKGELESYKN